MPTQPQPFVPWLSVVTQALQGRQKRQDVDYERNQEERAYNDQQAFRQQQLTQQAEAQDYARAQDRRQNERQAGLDQWTAFEGGYDPIEQTHAQGAADFRKAAPLQTGADLVPSYDVGAANTAAEKMNAAPVFSLGGTGYAKNRLSAAELAREDQQTQAKELRDAQSATSLQIAADALQGRREMATEALNGRRDMALLTASLRPAPTPKALTSIPPSMVDAMAQTHAAISSIDDAISTVASGKADGHIGPSRRFLPNFVSQMTDPGGNEIRGRIASIGSVIRHDLSGAAVTPREMKMLEPNIPDPTDPPQAAHEKLTRLRKQMSIIDADKRAYYSEENGYRSAPRSSLTPEASAAPSAPANPTQFPAGASPIPGAPRSPGDLVKR